MGHGFQGYVKELEGKWEKLFYRSPEAIGFN